MIWVVFTVNLSNHTVNMVFGREFDSNDLQFILYPNPTNESFNIRLINTTELQKVDLQVFNMEGRCLMNIIRSLNSTPVKIDGISSLESGIYTIRIICDGKSYVQKLVKM